MIASALVLLLTTAFADDTAERPSFTKDRTMYQGAVMASVRTDMEGFLSYGKVGGGVALRGKATDAIVVGLDARAMTAGHELGAALDVVPFGNGLHGAFVGLGLGWERQRFTYYPWEPGMHTKPSEEIGHAIVPALCER